MKYALLVFGALMIASCSIFKQKCTSVVLTSENAEMVHALGDNSMYAFRISTGDLAGASLHINSQGTGDKDAFLVNPSKNYVISEIEKEKWTINENLNLEKQVVEMKGSIALNIDGKVFCFELSYEGSMIKNPSPPPVPHQE